MTYEEMLAQRDKYFDELEVLNKKLTRIIKKIDKHLANTYDDVFYSNLRKNDFPKYLETILMSHVDGREIENNYYELQKFLGSYGVFSDGYYHETLQRSLQIRLNRNKNHETNKKQLECIELFLPYIKPLSDGYKHISILTSDLNEHAIYKLKVDKYNISCIYKASFREDKVKEFLILKNAFDYIAENLFIE